MPRAKGKPKPKAAADAEAPANELDDEYATGESTASETFPVQCSAIRKGDVVLVKGHPCKVVDMSTSKTGKHGHAKVHLTALDIFDQRKYEDICPSTHNMQKVNVKTVNYTVSTIDEDDYLDLMEESSSNAETRQDLKCTDLELLKQIKDNLETIQANDSNSSVVVSVVKAMGTEKVMTQKLAANNPK